MRTTTQKEADEKDPVLHKQAERWVASLTERWGLENFPACHDPAWQQQRMVECGGEWIDGSRAELVRRAARRGSPNKDAFLTLALRTWPADFLAGENFWLLPYQLAWSWAGVELAANGLPEGVSISALPLMAIERVC